MNFKRLETAQKLCGSYYTEPDIASFLSRWALDSKPQTILEPSCGDGAFIRAIAGLEHRSVREIVACELDENAAAQTKKQSKSLNRVNLKVFTQDFLQWALGRLEIGQTFDAAIGNPPFIRYQYLDPVLQARSEQIFSRFGLPFTKHTNAWVPFVIASVALLKPGGRLAMVVPSELLHVIHAKSLRDFLLQHCSQILLLDPSDIWFGDTLQGVMLLMAEKAENGNARATIAVETIRDRSELANRAATHFTNATMTCGSRMNGKWMLSLLNREEQSLLERLQAHPKIKQFKEIASVDVGIVTGANKFFLVPDSVIDEHGLSKWAHPMFGRSDHVRGVIYDKSSHEENKLAGLPTNFLWFDDAPFKSLPSRVQRYIADGADQLLNKRYKCSVRSPWYAVPSVYASPVGLLKRAHHFPKLVLNRLKALTTDTAYRIQPLKIKAATLASNFVNSLTALTAELEGRHYGGGVLELVPSEIEKLLIPLTQQSNTAIVKLDGLVRSGIPPERLLQIQDDAVLRPLGITAAECEILLRAWSRLRLRRQRANSSDTVPDFRCPQREI